MRYGDISGLSGQRTLKIRLLRAECLHTSTPSDPRLHLSATLESTWLQPESDAAQRSR